MKKQILSLTLTLCMLLCLLPVTALAEPQPNQDPPTAVATYDALKSALPDGNLAPNEEGVVTIPVATLTANLTLAAEQDIRTLGKLIVPSGVTLTVGSSFEAEVEIQSGGAVVVENGGYFGTTMGEDTKNAGTITVEQGGVMQSTMGASIVNESGGRIVLNGAFYCGSVNYDSTDHLWFENKGTITGGGDVIVYDAGAGDAERDAVDLDAMIGEVMDILGQTQRFGDGYWDDIGIYKQVEVNSLDALAALFNAERTIRGEAVEGNMDTIAVLNGDVTVPEDAALRGMVQVIVSSGVQLTVAGSLEAGVVIAGEAVEIAPAEVIVEPFGRLASTQGGKIENYGKLTVCPSGVLESQMGGEIENHAALTLDGLCYVGGYYNAAEDSRGEWFSSDSGATITGSGHIVVKPVAVLRENDENEADDASIRIEATKLVKSNIIGTNGVSIYTTATSFAEMQALNASSDVEGIYLFSEDAFDEDGNVIFNFERTEPIAGAELVITEDIDLTGKKLCIDAPDLVIGHDATLTVNSLSSLSFARRFTGRLVVDALGGTLRIGDTNVISGDPAKNAVFTPTKSYMWIGMAQWSDGAPTDTRGEWYYVWEDGEVSAAGSLDGIALPLLVDGTLNVTGDFTHPGSVEIRNGLTVAEGAAASIGDIDYGTGSKGPRAAVEGTNSTTYELEFDLNRGNGYDDVYDHLKYNDDKIYLQANGNEVPITPTRDGYTFVGWTATSGWTTAATPDKLAAFTVTGDGEAASVPVPTEFPVVMVAQWRSNSSGGTSTPSETTVTLPASGEPGSVAIEVKVSGNTATVKPLSDDAVDNMLSSGKASEEVVFDLSGLDKVNTVSIPSDSFAKVAAALKQREGDDTVTIKTGAGKAQFDETAVQSIAEQATGGNVSLTFESVGAEKLNAAQQSALESKELVGNYQFTMAVNGKTVADFAGGKAALTIPLIPAAGKEGKYYRVYYIADDGSMERMPTTFADNELNFITTHFSDYVLVYEVRSYVDVPEDWYYDAVYYCKDNGYFHGVDDAHFSPNGTMTRAMFATVLYRIAGEPSVAGAASDLADVEAGMWYTDAAIWALSEKLMEGYGNERFGIDDPVTREQMAVLFWRCQKKPAAQAAALSKFTDTDDVSDWARDAFSWAVSTGVVSGKGNGTLDPAGVATRAEVAQIVMNYDTQVK